MHIPMVNSWSIDKGDYQSKGIDYTLAEKRVRRRRKRMKIIYSSSFMLIVSILLIVIFQLLSKVK
jgi:hypothetical protein